MAKIGGIGRAAAVLSAVLLVSGTAAEARVTKITIGKVTSPQFNGQTFGPNGSIGAYEELRGTFSGEIDPFDRRSAVITDILLAPRNSRGKVEYTATFTLLKPIDMGRASGVLVYGVSNRGGRALGTGMINVTPDKPAGDGFPYNTGHVYVASGWQGDLVFNADPNVAAETISVPVAKNPDGTSITSPTFARFVTVAPTNGANTTTQSLPGRGRTPNSLDTTKATLISIAHENNLGVRTGVLSIASADWAFADCRTVPFPGTPDATRICLRNGFDPSLAYELVYTAKDPLVLGIGMAATRDIFSFLRHATLDDAGTHNPIAGKIRWGIGYGISQSGRYLKTFILDGFNEDEDGRIVFDGAQPIIAGSMGQFNVRFAQPGNIANIFEAGAEGPIWWGEYDDVMRRRGVTSLQQRCSRTNTCPKVIDEFGGPEMWYTRGGAGIIGTSGTRVHKDIKLPKNVRRYYHAGTAHGGGNGGFDRVQPAGTTLMLASNPNPETETRRALIVARDDWVTRGKKPPKSSYPSLNEGTLTDSNAEAMGWPDIPGSPTPDHVMNVVMDYDWGPQFRYNDQAGVESNVVPRIKQTIPTPASKVDRDGNEIGGVRSVLLQAPLGTYTPWNPVASGPLKGNEGNLAAGYIAFAQTRAERLAAGDPRLSVEERYGSQEGYNCVVQDAAASLVKQRLLLQEDADRLIAQAAASNVLPSDPHNHVARQLCSEHHHGHDDDGDDDDRRDDD
jgi:hypothetical protein